MLQISSRPYCFRFILVKDLWAEENRSDLLFFFFFSNAPVLVGGGMFFVLLTHYGIMFNMFIFFSVKKPHQNENRED